jgi:Putative manganese efflux pump
VVSLPATLATHNANLLVSWISQTFLQLVLLSVIIVGQNVLAAAADKRSEATYNDADAVLHEAVKSRSTRWRRTRCSAPSPASCGPRLADRGSRRLEPPWPAGTPNRCRRRAAGARAVHTICMLPQLRGPGFVGWCPMLALLLVAVSLGLSSFAVAIAIGVSGVDARTRLRTGLAFGLFEAAMPLLGLLLGHGLARTLGHAARWIGAALLIGTGLDALTRVFRHDRGDAAEAAAQGLGGSSSPRLRSASTTSPSASLSARTTSPCSSRRFSSARSASPWP